MATRKEAWATTMPRRPAAVRSSPAGADDATGGTEGGAGLPLMCRTGTDKSRSAKGCPPGMPSPLLRTTRTGTASRQGAGRSRRPVRLRHPRRTCHPPCRRPDPRRRPPEVCHAPWAVPCTAAQGPRRNWVRHGWCRRRWGPYPAHRPPDEPSPCAPPPDEPLPCVPPSAPPDSTPPTASPAVGEESEDDVGRADPDSPEPPCAQPDATMSAPAAATTRKRYLVLYVSRYPMRGQLPLPCWVRRAQRPPTGPGSGGSGEGLDLNPSRRRPA